MKLLALLFATALPLGALAQGGDIPKPVLDGLAKDLAQLHQAVLEAQRKQQAYEMASAKFPWLGVNQITITSPSAGVRAGANDKAPLLLSAQKNQIFPVIDKAGDWYAVALREKIHGVSSGWVRAADSVPTMRAVQTTPAGQQPSSLADDIFRELTERAVRFRDAYRNNPYISVTGFSVNVGVPPSVSISFEFKK